MTLTKIKQTKPISIPRIKSITTAVFAELIIFVRSETEEIEAPKSMTAPKNTIRPNIKPITVRAIVRIRFSTPKMVSLKK